MILVLPSQTSFFFEEFDLGLVRHLGYIEMIEEFLSILPFMRMEYFVASRGGALCEAMGERNNKIFRELVLNQRSTQKLKLMGEDNFNII